MPRKFRTREPDTASPRRRRLVWRLVLLFIIFPALLFAGYTWLTLHFVFSSGERSGYVQKISRRGWLCKTWEGELAMTPMPGATPIMFQFSVRNNDTAAQIQQAAGKRVVLSYDQHRGIPGSCFGETEYFVTGVRLVGQ